MFGFEFNEEDSFVLLLQAWFCWWWQSPKLQWPVVFPCLVLCAHRGRRTWDSKKMYLNGYFLCTSKEDGTFPFSPPSSDCGIWEKPTLLIQMLFLHFLKKDVWCKMLFLSCSICCVTAWPAACFRVHNFLNLLMLECKTQILHPQCTWNHFESS